MGCTSSSQPVESPVKVVSNYSPPKPTIADIEGLEGFRSPAALPTQCVAQKLGAGAYAKVYALTRTQGLFKEPFANKPLAAKVIKFHEAQNKESLETRYAKAKREAKVWEHVCSKHNSAILSLAETFLDSNAVVFVMERCEMSLSQHIHSLPRLDEQVVAGMLREMVESLQHIHALDVIHRDVKPDNFLVNDGLLKLSDFGLAVRSDDIWEKGNEPHPVNNPHPAPMVAGTAPFMSPEMLSKVKYDTQTDIWSVGVLAYLMFYGQFPYMPKEMSGSAMKAAIREGKQEIAFMPGLDALFPGAPLGNYTGPSEDAVDLLKSMLGRKAGDRPTAAAALQHPFLMQLGSEEYATLPNLRPVFKRAVRCGAFEPARPSQLKISRPSDSDDASRRLSETSRSSPKSQAVSRWATGTTYAPSLSSSVRSCDSSA